MDRRINKITYKDFEIGQHLICDNDAGFFEDHLTVGKSYIIDDLDFHFHDKVCVVVNNGKSMFIPIKCFKTLKLERTQKLDSLDKFELQSKNKRHE